MPKKKKKIKSFILNENINGAALLSMPLTVLEDVFGVLQAMVGGGPILDALLSDQHLYPPC